MSWSSWRGGGDKVVKSKMNAIKIYLFTFTIHAVCKKVSKWYLPRLVQANKHEYQSMGGGHIVFVSVTIIYAARKLSILKRNILLYGHFIQGEGAEDFLLFCLNTRLWYNNIDYRYVNYIVIDPISWFTQLHYKKV